MLLAPHPALNQVLGIMLGVALALGDMASAWQERHLPSVRAAVPAKVCLLYTSDAADESVAV
ncbi:hypothetical protein PP719_16370 [Ralstonia solanacearum]|uniref:hypothetical protein n=1 Tax=Ralstonia solanacearum TaxID=305 RepID=UPI002481FBB0|nr:hypothetical protein [Ralstonia solanacearum]MDC6240544.1 hypothetical protein [Ralstonia solanacearum]